MPCGPATNANASCPGRQRRGHTHATDQARHHRHRYSALNFKPTRAGGDGRIKRPCPKIVAAVRRSWTAINGAKRTKRMVPRVGFEPTAYRLRSGCSTAELSGHG